jgi:hypothetical protein
MRKYNGMKNITKGYHDKNSRPKHSSLKGATS